ncbi:membrane-bound lytic murein transglycosylase C [Vibrio xiamenensis]|uniref:Membrane-bound lytic murein transglycosylase C n=1 Tax=Vibrio xiamenensis TaxID=861298 RepID=A0A1G7W6W4_9VIBR|nr:transglycosylase SLT domain-containing protein [Vibrio xiamenensis]SDG67715.1 membrane-bound lytic murein transglycosylase C [Vibrio xiamenensis]
MRLHKRHLVAMTLAGLLSAPPSVSNDAFDELKKATQKPSKEQRYQEFVNYINARLDEYESWREQYTKQLDQTRHSQISTWGSAQVSDNTLEVEYSADDTVRKVVDYENNTSTISVLVDAQATQEQIQQTLKQHQQLTLQDSLVDAEISQQVVDYSLQQQSVEKAFIVQQTQKQMNEYDIQAERLIAAKTGIPDKFIYQRAHAKKMALVEEAKQRIAAMTQLFEHKRQELGIVEPKVAQLDANHAPKVIEAETSTPAVASREIAVEAKPQLASAESEKIVLPVESDAVTDKTAQLEAFVEPASMTNLNTSEPQTVQAPLEDLATSAKAEQDASLAKTAPLQKTPVEVAKVEAQAENTPETKMPIKVAALSNSSTPAVKKVVSYKISLPNNSLSKRANQYQPLVLQESEKWSIDPALVMAIMHSESAFRPQAKSHIPAFGLMQIVPTTAGRDVNRKVNNRDEPMLEAELYRPGVNVEAGTVYLHILDSQYLKSITNEQSRLYCTIAAYNTGAGNVAKAFNSDRSTNIRIAAKVINTMTPEQVYQRLITHLPYDETKNYLKKVSSRIALYQPKIAM